MWACHASHQRALLLKIDATLLSPRALRSLDLRLERGQMGREEFYLRGADDGKFLEYQAYAHTFWGLLEIPILHRAGEHVEPTLR